MRIISTGRLKKYWHQPLCGDSEQSLRMWVTEAKKASWKTPQDVKTTFGNASIVANMNNNIRPIKTEADNEAALARIETLWDAEPNTPEGDELDVLATLVAAFEEKFYAIEAPDPIAAIRFRMEQDQLEDKDLVPFIGQRSHVSEILSRKRKLSIAMIRKLSKGLNIPVEQLISEYPLEKRVN